MAIDPDVEARLAPLETAVAELQATPHDSATLRESYAFQAKLFAALAVSNDPAAIWQKLSTALDQ